MITWDKNCTACGACVQKCPKACITMQEDKNGFLFPKVDKEKCVGCGLCEKVCHLNINTSNDKTKTAVACVHRSEEVLKRSTSGGAFSAIAERIFACGGIVYGCGYVTPTQPQHIRIERQDDMKKLCGSKYVQSTIENAYRQVFDDLCAEKLVFFTGTPCQVAGLKAFLGKTYDNLITADIICHGVPSVAYFKKYVDWYEEKHQCKLIDFDFRSKENAGWSYAGICKTEKSGKNYTNKVYYFDEYYYFYFLKSEVYRDCCYDCKYTNVSRPGDFTLGDFWGAEGQKLGFSTDNGCSLVLLNTQKAQELFKKMNVNSTEINLDYAVANNAQLRTPSKHTELREVLLREYRECSGAEIQKRFIKRFRLVRMKARIKYAIPQPVKKFLLRIRYFVK